MTFSSLYINNLQVQAEKDDLERKCKLIESDLDRSEERVTELQDKNKSLEAQVDETER